MDVGVLVDKYNKWAGSTVVPEAVKRLHFVSGMRLGQVDPLADQQQSRRPSGSSVGGDGGGGGSDGSRHRGNNSGGCGGGSSGGGALVTQSRGSRGSSEWLPGRRSIFSSSDSSLRSYKLAVAIEPTRLVGEGPEEAWANVACDEKGLRGAADAIGMSAYETEPHTVHASSHSACLLLFACIHAVHASSSLHALSARMDLCRVCAAGTRARCAASR